MRRSEIILTQVKFHAERPQIWTQDLLAAAVLTSLSCSLHSVRFSCKQVTICKRKYRLQYIWVLKNVTSALLTAFYLQCTREHLAELRISLGDHLLWHYKPSLCGWAERRHSVHLDFPFPVPESSSAKHDKLLQLDRIMPQDGACSYRLK